MAKRFIDTTIFRKDFIRSLEAPYKLLWLYIINECDHAGLWDKELDVAAARLGVKFSANPIDKFLGKVIEVNSGSKWFIPSFVEFQYGQLNESNRVHASVILALKKYCLLDETNQIKPLTSPLQGAIDKDMVKDKDRDMEKDKGQPTEKNQLIDLIPSSWPVSEFSPLWSDYILGRKQRKRPLTENAAKINLQQLVRTFPMWPDAKARMEKVVGSGWLTFVFDDDKTKSSGKTKSIYEPGYYDKA